MSLRHESYATGAGHEWLAVHGPEAGIPLLIVPPLFEEANFTASVVSDMARRLAEAGVTAWVIDLPGTAESLLPLEAVGWIAWRDAVRDAAAHVAGRQGRPHVAAIRGGALLDDAADAASHWRFAPAAGASLLRQMERAQAIGDREAGGATAAGGTIELVGYRLSLPFADALRGARPTEPPVRCRTRDFAGSGVAPWRRAEPTSDHALAADLARDIAEWLCAA